MKELSIENIEITNKEVLVTYTPLSNVTSYSYIIEKDGIKTNPVYVNSNQKTDITLSDTGTYKIEITSINTLGIQNVITGNYKIDKEPPILNVTTRKFKIKTNEKLNYLDGVTASDINDGDLTGNIKTNIDTLDLTHEGIKTIEYSVSDKAGNTTTTNAYITVIKDNTNIIRLGQFEIVILVLFIILFLMKYIRSIKLEKRFSRYTINSSKNKSISLLDNLHTSYLDFINKLSKLFSKSSVMIKISNRYNKYSCMFENYDSMNFVSRKVVYGFLYIIIAMIIKLAYSRLLSPLEMAISFIIGFYTLDIIYIIKYQKYKKSLENDIITAITIMNNSFKSGKSIIQAVEMVIKELSGPISNEFKIIKQEISYGIDIDESFKRFKSRVKIKEAMYLSSSISVLNKTGGNVIKVFDTIERNAINRRKLQNELKALTSSSKLITYVLIFVPSLFIIFIGMINPGYFEPLFKNIIGIILILLMLVIYITYIVIVKKIMRVKV